MDAPETSNNNQQPKPSVKQKVRPYKKPLMLVGAFIVIAVVAFSGWAIFTKEDAPPTSENPIVASYQQQLPTLADDAENKPDDAKAQGDYAVALYATGDTSKAKDQYEAAVKLDPNNATYYNNLGNSYRDLSQYDQAVESYQKATSLDPKAPNPYMNLANLYLFTLKQPDLAIKTYQEALKNIPNNQDLEVLLAIAYEQSGDKANAKTAYALVLSQNPNNTAAQAGLKRVE